VARRGWAFDIAIAAVTLVLVELEAWYGINATHRQGPHSAQAVAYGIGAVVLVWRRVRPLDCLIAMVAVYLVEFVLVGAPEGYGVAVPPLIAVYSVARWERRRPAWWGLVVVLAFGVGWLLTDPLDRSWTQRGSGAMWLSPWVIGWLVGALVRSRAQAREQRRVSREQRAAQAVAEERNRIARELHDVLGHSVSVMTVQASAVRRRLTDDQVVEREALEVVEATGREALAEMRRMVGVLREDGHATGREPPPGLGQVERLAEKFRAAGLPVRLTVTGTPRPLAPGLDLTAYRLLQEGLTNTLRHAVVPARVDVAVTYLDDCLELAVRDDGLPVDGQVEPGHGLLGMRERVSVYGGRIEARRLSAGGFELVAALPVEMP
jgi:signal transduction histidine kinase